MEPRPNPSLITHHSSLTTTHQSSLFRQIHQFKSVTSTNDIAREMAAAGAPEGTVVRALEQTSGRGRQGRSWNSPASQGLYLSVVLRPQAFFPVVQLIPLAAGVAVAEALKDIYAASPDIKWPNDIMIGGRKACGILVESSTESTRMEFAILGIGVNLGQEEFPEDIRATATSMLKETGLLIAPDDLLGPLLDRLDRWYRAIATDSSAVINRWEELSTYARDCTVRIAMGDTTLEGVTAGLNAAGALIVELPGGERREVFSGEVTLRKVMSNER